MGKLTINCHFQWILSQLPHSLHLQRTFWRSRALRNHMAGVSNKSIIETSTSAAFAPLGTEYWVTVVSYIPDFPGQNMHDWWLSYQWISPQSACNVKIVKLLENPNRPNHLRTAILFDLSICAMVKVYQTIVYGVWSSIPYWESLAVRI